MFDIETYVDNLMQESKRFTAVDDVDVLNKVKENLTDTVEDHINAMILAEMPPQKLVEFEKIVDSDNEAKMTAFISANIPNLDVKLTQLLIDFKKSYLGL